MKTFNIQVKTVDHAKTAINEYAINNPSVLPPIKGTYGRWTLSWYASKHMDTGKWECVINMILFPKTIKMLLDKYGKKIEKTLIHTALMSKEKKLIQALWKYVDEDSKKNLMTEFLGAK